MKSKELQEQENAALKKQIDSQVVTQKKRIASHQSKIVTDYFDKSIKLFQDDQVYSVEFRTNFLAKLAFELRQFVFEATMEKIESTFLINLNEKSHNTAVNLQNACSLLYLLG